MDKLLKKESKNAEKTKSKNTKKPKLNNVEKVKSKKIKKSEIKNDIKIVPINNTKANRVFLGIIIFLLFIIFSCSTKLGIIPNIFDIDVLCPGQENNNVIIPQNIESNNINIPESRGNINGHTSLDKPVIYLYPQEKMDIRVKLDYKGKLIADYPNYNYDIKGWDVTAEPDSTIINKSDNKEYSYLFWEGIPKKEIDWDIDKGFVVKGSESKEFLQEILPKIGLTLKEYNEFIVYWYPIMQANSYNLVHFSGKQYTDNAPLETIPQYDSLLRVFMVIKPLDKPIDIQPQIFNGFERKGFSVVEWGGTILK